MIGKILIGNTEQQDAILTVHLRLSRVSEDII